jgi:hypothetical protein
VGRIGAPGRDPIRAFGGGVTLDRVRFDEPTRRSATGLPRRHLLVGLAAGRFGSSLGRPRPAAAGCKKAGKKCDRNNDRRVLGHTAGDL